MIRTARVLVTLFFFTLIFDLAAHAKGKAAVVREHQAPMNPRDDQRQPGQSLKATARVSGEADSTAPKPPIKATTGHGSGETTVCLRRICLTAPQFSQVLAISQNQSTPWKSLADYSIKMFGRRRQFQMRFSMDLAATLA